MSKRTRIGSALAAGMAVLAIAPTSDAAPPNDNTIVHNATDQCGKHAVMRQGRYDGAGKGWGYAKMAGKHGLHNKTVFDAVLTDPTCGRPDGTSREYHKMAQQWERWWIFYYLKDEREVISVVDYRDEPGVGQKGMITTYCNQGGEWECPAWVNSEPPFPPDTQASDGSTVTTFTDSPLPAGARLTEQELARLAD